MHSAPVLAQLIYGAHERFLYHLVYTCILPSAVQTTQLTSYSWDLKMYQSFWKAAICCPPPNLQQSGPTQSMHYHQPVSFLRKYKAYPVHEIFCTSTHHLINFLRLTIICAANKAQATRGVASDRQKWPIPRFENGCTCVNLVDSES